MYPSRPIRDFEVDIILLKNSLNFLITPICSQDIALQGLVIPLILRYPLLPYSSEVQKVLENKFSRACVCLGLFGCLYMCVLYVPVCVYVPLCVCGRSRARARACVCVCVRVRVYVCRASRACVFA